MCRIRYFDNVFCIIFFIISKSVFFLERNVNRNINKLIICSLLTFWCLPLSKPSVLLSHTLPRSLPRLSWPQVCSLLSSYYILIHDSTNPIKTKQVTETREKLDNQLLFFYEPHSRHPDIQIGAFGHNITNCPVVVLLI